MSFVFLDTMEEHKQLEETNKQMEETNKSEEAPKPKRQYKKRSATEETKQKDAANIQELIESLENNSDAVVAKKPTKRKKTSSVDPSLLVVPLPVPLPKDASPLCSESLPQVASPLCSESLPQVASPLRVKDLPDPSSVPVPVPEPPEKKKRVSRKKVVAEQPTVVETPIVVQTQEVITKPQVVETQMVEPEVVITKPPEVVVAEQHVVVGKQKTQKQKSNEGHPQQPQQTQQHSEDDVHVIKQANGQQTVVFDPYNPLNKLIGKEDIEALLSTYGITTPIHNPEIYKRAFVHRSYVRRPESELAEKGITLAAKPDACLPLYSKSNERLEFVGDGVLECVTKYYLYRRFPQENEGFMTSKKIELVKNEHIGRIAYEMGLHKWYILSKNAEFIHTRSNLKKLGCLFESFVGAMFLDFNKIAVEDSQHWFRDVFVCGPGFQMVQIFIERVFEKHVDWTNLIYNDTNYKNILQAIVQKEFKVTPHYLERYTPWEKQNLAQNANAHAVSAEDKKVFHMGAYLCLGQAIHDIPDLEGAAVPLTQFRSFDDMHEYMSSHRKMLILLGEAKHKIKKKAEQMACESAIQCFANTWGLSSSSASTTAATYSSSFSTSTR